ncbi:MAG: hypothetical protein ACTSRE_11000 [Promethearchaeota archaeon]
MVLVYTSIYNNNDSRQENLLSIPPATPSFFPTELTWGIGWGSENIDIAEDVWANEDTIYVVGSIEANTTNSKLMLSKFTQNIHIHREQIWSVNWSGNSATFGKGVWSNGTDIYTVGQYSDNLVLIKWDTNGTQIWNSTWNLGSEFGGVHSILGINNEIYVCGVYIDDLLLIKWNNEGTQIWNRTWGGIYWEEAFDVWGEGSDIYTCGSTSSYGTGSNDSLIIRWDSEGNQIWNKTWGKVTEDYFKAIYGIGDELYTCGSTWRETELSSDVLIMKWFSNGTRDWRRVTGEHCDDIGNSIWVNDYHVYVGGTTFEKGGDDDEFEEEGNQLILKYSYSGEREEKFTWGGTSNETCNGIYVTNDNLYTVGTYGPHQSHYVIRYYTYNYIQPPDFLRITPNPCTNGSFFLEWEEVAGAEYYNLYKDVHPILDISNRTPYLSLTSTNLTEIELNEGTYFYVLTTMMRGTESIISLPRIVELYFSESSKRNVPGYNVFIIFSLLGISAMWFYRKKIRKMN